MLERIASNGVKTTRAKRFAVSTMMAALPSDQAITTAPPLPGERLSRCLRLPTPLLTSCSQAGCRERQSEQKFMKCSKRPPMIKELLSLELLLNYRRNRERNWRSWMLSMIIF